MARFKYAFRQYCANEEMMRVDALPHAHIYIAKTQPRFGNKLENWLILTFL